MKTYGRLNEELLNEFERFDKVRNKKQTRYEFFISKETFEYLLDLLKRDKEYIDGINAMGR